MYWHHLLEEYINRYTEGLSKNYLPQISEIGRDSRLNKKNHSRVDLVNGLYLTHREAECMHWIITGLTMKAVAIKLNLSPRTIEYYLKRLKARWGCKNKKALIVYAQQSGFNTYHYINDRY